MQTRWIGIRRFESASGESSNGRRWAAGFTLIELLVVIAIIALLISIILPALGKARRSGQEAKNAANLKSMGLAMTLYANDWKNWLPLIPMRDPVRTQFQRPPRPRGAGFNPSYASLDEQYLCGGVAGFFSLNQRGDYDPASGNGNPGYGGTTPDQKFYPGGSKVPVMRNYLDAFGILTNPADKLDYAYFNDEVWQANTVRIPFPQAPKIPKAPTSEFDVVSYNISYLYIAGLKLDEPQIMTAAPFWGDETVGPDISTNAWYGGGGNGPGRTVGNALGVPAGGYSSRDNLGSEGGAFVFTDGHASFLRSTGGDPATAESIQNRFFSTDTTRFPNSINVITGTRSDRVSTTD